MFRRAHYYTPVRFYTSFKGDHKNRKQSEIKKGIASGGAGTRGMFFSSSPTAHLLPLPQPSFSSPCHSTETAVVDLSLKSADGFFGHLNNQRIFFFSTSATLKKKKNTHKKNTVFKVLHF